MSGYPIQPIIIWNNGTTQTGNFFSLSIIMDNLVNTAQFLWTISNFNEDEDNPIYLKITSGNLTISGEDYIDWGLETDVNFYAYQWAADQLNLTLITQ